jgi:hypothetical protein
LCKHTTNDKLYVSNAGTSNLLIIKNTTLSTSGFEVASLSKSVFAYFEMKQVDKDPIDLNKPLNNYVAYKDIEYDERYEFNTSGMVLSHYGFAKLEKKHS